MNPEEHPNYDVLMLKFFELEHYAKNDSYLLGEIKKVRDYFLNKPKSLTVINEDF